jgi:predicted  nucleic acid-binding Zn-ribbon protein
MRQSHVVGGVSDESRRGPKIVSMAFYAVVCLLVLKPSGRDSFRLSCPIPQPRRQPFTLLYSSVGPPNKGGGGDGPFGDFLIPKDESENMFKAREYLNENSLPISYDYDDEKNAAADADADGEQNRDDSVAMEQEEQEGKELKSAALVSSSDGTTTTPLEKLAQNNPYIDIVSRISPSELISKFSTTAHPRVQTAVRNTILGLLGGLPKMTFDTTTVTTGQKLASLMFQLQMTGYMFKVKNDLSLRFFN